MQHDRAHHLSRSMGRRFARLLYLGGAAVSIAFSVLWYDSGLEPRCAFNAEYPHGRDIDGSSGAAKTCVVPLPYPAARCGMYQVRCKTCGLSVGVSTAGRIDDPTSIKLACHSHRMR